MTIRKLALAATALLVLSTATTSASPRRHVYDSGRPAACYGIPWCGCWLRLRKGIADKAYNLAHYWKHYGHHVDGPVVGAVAIMRHRHVGEVVGIDANGNPIVISGNHNHAVQTATYPKHKVAEYRM